MRYRFTEGSNLAGSVDEAFLDALSKSLDRVSEAIRPSLPLYARKNNSFIVQNLIGVIDLQDGSLVEFAPKIYEENWAEATISLLGPSTRIHAVFTDRRGVDRISSKLTEAVAAEYSARLNQAIRIAGPMLSYERHKALSPTLRGKLNVRDWLVRSALDPAHFVVESNDLAFDNSFTRAMDFVAGLLIRTCTASETRTSLSRARTLLRPDCPEAYSVDNAIAFREFPAQWTAYKPAWDIASAVLRERPLHCGGHEAGLGVELAVEPWPLLETLLMSCLEWICKQTDFGDSYAFQCAKQLFEGLPGRVVKSDGILLKNGRTIACFDAKYKTEKLAREDVYQVIATASRFNSPVAILVYPDGSPARCYRTLIRGNPRVVATAGIDMFKFSHRMGPARQSTKLVDCLKLALRMVNDES